MMKCARKNVRVVAVLCTTTALALVGFCPTAHASRGIRTDFPSLTSLGSFTGTSVDWAVPGTNDEFFLKFAPGTSLTNGCEWEGAADDLNAPPNADTVYMFNWFPNNGLPCTSQSQEIVAGKQGVQEQVLIYTLENSSGQSGFNIGFAVDFNYPTSTNCPKETATFTEDTPFYGQPSYKQGNPCANSAAYPDNDSFVLDGLTLTQSTTWGAVPEPGTLALLLLGLSGMSWALIRRRKIQASLQNG